MIQKLKNADPRLLTILLIVFVQIVGASMVLPILPLYAQRNFAMTPQVITLLITIFFAAQFLAGPIIGRMSDNYGRLPVLIISQVGTVISFAMLGLAESVTILFVARLLDGITGGNIIVAQAYITDITPKEERTQALGYIFAAFGLGFILGPALGGVLSALFGDRIPFLLAAIAATITVVITWTTLTETVTVEQRESNRLKGKRGLNPVDVLTNRPLMLILLITFGGQFAFGMLQSTFALFGEAVWFADFNPRMTNLGVGLLLAVVGLGQFFTQMFLLKRVLKRYGDGMVALMGLALRGVSMFMIAWVTALWLTPVGAILFAIGSGFMMPTLQSLATNTVPDEFRGGVLGWYQSAFSLSIIFSTAIAGTLFEITPQTPYLVGGTLFLVMTIPAIFLVRWSRQQAAVDDVAVVDENKTVSPQATAATD